jgi:PKD repeat protein
MKQYFNYLCLIALLFTFSAGFAQQDKKNVTKKGVNDQFDPRVDNMGYWMKKAAQGLIPYNPNIPIPPAIYRGSMISAPGVKSLVSTDVPVTNLTNVTESENSVFIDPNNADFLLNSNNSTSWTGTAFGELYGASYFQSSNAGIGWVGSPLAAGGINSGDPTTAISLTGRQYINFIDDPGGQGVAYSDNGTSWTTATIAPNPGSLADKNHMWIDNSLSSIYKGNLYTAWTDFGGSYDYDVVISRSTNNGVTWSTRVPISGNIASFNHGVNLQTGPAGQVYAVWATYPTSGLTEDGIGFNKSLDGGATFGTATKIISNIKGIRGTGVLKNMRVNSFPVMAVDISGGPNNGNIFVVWSNIGVPGINTGTNKSIYIIRSTDGGTTWSTPVRINKGPFLDGKEAYSPWISCDAVTGNLSVVFYDDRNVSSTQCETFAAYSYNAGNTWTDFVVSDVAFTPVAIPGLASGYMGDYLGITSRNSKVYPCWTDNRGGIYMTYVSPFYIGLNAEFGVNSAVVCSGAGAIFTDVSTGPPTSWTWSFPGGTPSSYVGQIPPVITYSAPGSYNVSLTVSDGVGVDTETKTAYITVQNVIADFTGAPTTVVVGNSVTFTDNSSCGPETWIWSFPGGTPSSYIGQTPPPVVYNTLGTYNVSLTVTKAGGTDTKTKTGYITVTPPIFNITAGSVTTCTGDFYDTGGPTGVYQNNEVITETFYPSTPGSMIRFAFTSFATELGYDTLTIYNGVNSSAPLIGKYHGTTGPGTVTASNASGALTFRFSSDVSLTYAGWAATISCYNTNIPPVANFSASTTSPVVAQTVSFTDLSTNGATSWAWSFSPATVTYVGGTSATSQNPQVQFPATGSYTVSLTATNAYGFDSETKINYINVTNCTISTLPFSESFSATTIPSCWSQVDHKGNGQVWKFGVITGQSPDPVLTGNYAYLDSDDYGSGNSQNADLITPTFDLSAYTGITLQFSHYFKSYSGSSGTVSYSLNNGTTWVQLQQFTTTSLTNPAAFSQVIPALAGQSQVKLKWNYTGAWAWYWGIDNVSVTGTCNTVLPVSVSISASSNPVDAGTQVTYTATGVNGGTSPVYQWKVNNVNAGTNSSTYQYIPSDGDVVTCVLTSNANCVTGNPASSNAVTMTVNSVPVIRNINDVTVSGTQCFDATQTIIVAGSNTAFSVVSGGSATLIAGENILFYPGTTVYPGAYLHGSIAPGGPYCIGPTKPTIAAGSRENTILPERTFFRVYPNPTTGKFTLTLDGYVPGEKVEVDVYNIKGEKIISDGLLDEVTREFSLSGMPVGLYLIRVISETRIGTARLVKQ